MKKLKPFESLGTAYPFNEQERLVPDWVNTLVDVVMATNINQYDLFFFNFELQHYPVAHIDRY